MSIDLPYTYVSCPCSETFNSLNNSGTQLRIGGHDTSGESPGNDVEDEAEERPFDPRSPRSAYSLYPLDQLLYCEDCHQLRCPRCILEEIVCFYCPSCLFEVPSSLVKSEGNRCSRNCYNCPVCTAPLSVNGLDTAPPSTAEHTLPGGPWVLGCPYCNWSSQEVGIVFEKPNNISGQLAKMRNADSSAMPSHEREQGRDRQKSSESVADEREPAAPDGTRQMDAEKQFANLKSFYTSQLLEHAPAGSSSLGLSSTNYGYGSPGTLSRIMGMYTGVGGYGRKKEKGKTEVMREAREAKEGRQILEDEDETITKMKEGGFDEITSLVQRVDVNGDARFPSDLRPLPTLLRTKRSKRCRVCRHILVRPESKVQSTRFRIKLLAQNYIPNLSLRPLNPPPVKSPNPTQTLTPPELRPLTPSQHLLTFTNPLFDLVRLTLATPSRTPGRFSSKVTILCPEFEVGANTDVWDEALSNTTSSSSTLGRDRSNRSGGDGGGSGAAQAEAGKIWDKGRNWTSVVLEVVPAALQQKPSLSFFPSATTQHGSGEVPANETTPGAPAAEDGDEDDHILEDEDILEIPLFVRVEYETEAVVGGGTGLGEDVPGGSNRPGSEGRRGEGEAGGGSEGAAKAGGGKEKRELAYWCVVGVGRIAQ